MSEPMTCPGCGAELRVEIASVKPASSDGMPVCTGCRKVRPGSEWVVLSDKTWWHALCAAEELFRQLAQRDERNAALEDENKKLTVQLAAHISALDEALNSGDGAYRP